MLVFYIQAGIISLEGIWVHLSPDDDALRNIAIEGKDKMETWLVSLVEKKGLDKGYGDAPAPAVQRNFNDFKNVELDSRPQITALFKDLTQNNQKLMLAVGALNVRSEARLCLGGWGWAPFDCWVAY